jgi:single-strand DNA-binding protein
MKINTNICVITGNVTRDAELRYTAKQTPVLGFTVACNRQGQDGQSAADFFPVVLWGKSAEALEKYLTKGKSVLVKGRLQTRSYESKTGEKRNVTEIVADNFGGVELLGGGERAQGGYTQQPPAQNQRPQSARGGWNPLDVDEPEPSAQSARTQEQGDFPF